MPDDTEDMQGKPKLPADPDFGPKDSLLPYHDPKSSGTEPRHLPNGRTTVGSEGRAPVTDEPARPGPVENVKFLSDQFDMPAGTAAVLVAGDTPADADAVRDKVIERQKREKSEIAKDSPLPVDDEGEPDQPSSVMEKPVLDKAGE